MTNFDRDISSYRSPSIVVSPFSQSRRAAFLATTAAAAIAVMLAAGPSRAQEWDAGGGGGPAVGGDGNWNTTVGGGLWFNGTTNVDYVAGGNVTFGDASPVAGYTVTINEGLPLSVNSMTFTTDGVTIAAGAATDSLQFVGGDIDVQAGFSADISASIISGDLNVVGDGDLVLSGVNATLGAVNQTGTGQTAITGTLATGNALVTAGELVVSGFVTNGAVSVTSGNLNNSGLITSTVDVSGTGGFLNSGSVSGAMTFSSSAGGENLTGGNIADLTVTSGDFDSSSTVGTLNVSGGDFENRIDGSISGMATVDDGGSITADGGTFDDITVNSTTSDGVLNVTANTVSSGVVEAAGSILGGDGLTLESFGFTLSGNLVGGGTSDFTLSTTGTIALETGYTITNNVALDFGELQTEVFYSTDGDATLQGNVVVQANGELSIDGAAMDADGHEIEVETNGALDVNENLTGIGFFQNSGNVDVADGATLSADSINHLGGQITLGTNSTLEGTGNTINNNALTVVGDGGSVLDAGDINNNGAASGGAGVFQFLGAGTINADSDNVGGEVLFNTGVISSDNGDGGAPGVDVITIGDGSGDILNNGQGGELIVGTGDIWNGADLVVGNTGTSAAATDDATINVGVGSQFNVFDINNNAFGTITNDGTISIDAGQVLDNAANGTITSSGTITGAITNDGNLTSTGVITGDLINQGTGQVDVQGTLTGAISNSGTTANIEVTGVLSGVTTIDNNDTATIDITGANLSANGAVTNEGTINVGDGGGENLIALSLTNEDTGQINVADGSDISVDGGIDNQSGATITTNGDVSFFVDEDDAGDEGVNNSGTINVNGAAATLTIDTGAGDGTVTLANNAGGVINVAAGNTLTSSDQLTLDSIGGVGDLAEVNVGVGGTIDVFDLNNNLSTVNNDGTITIDGTQALDNFAGSTVNNSSTGTINADVVNAGTLTSENVINGDLSNQEDGVANLEGSLNGSIVNGTASGAATINVTGDLDGVTSIDNNVNANLNVSGGNLVATGALTNAGTVTVGDGGGENMTVDSVTNESGGIIDINNGSTLSSNAGVTNQTGAEINVSGVATLTVDADDTALATIENNGEFNVNGPAGSVLTINTGNAAGTVTLNNNVSGSIDVADGNTLQQEAGQELTITSQGAGSTIDVGVGSNLTVHDIENNADSTITNDGTITLDAGEVLTNASGATLNSTGVINAQVDNDGVANLAGSVNGDVNNNGTGDLDFTGALTITGSLTNDFGGVIDAEAGLTTVTVDITNDAELDIENGASLSSPTITNSATGDIDVEAGGTLISSAGIDNDGDLDNAGTITGNVDNSLTMSSTGLVTGDITNTGDLDIEGVAAAAGVDGDINATAGTFDVTGDLDVTGDVTNSGSSAMTLGSATLEVGGTFTQSSSAALTIDADDEILADTVSVTTTVANSGVLEAVGGDLTIGAAGDVSGTGETNAGGDIVNSGILSSTGAGSITATTVDNSGTLTSTNSITGDVENTGVADLEGDVTGDVTTSGASTLTATNTLDITGDLSVEDNATFDITMGTVTATGTVTQDSSVAITIDAGEALNGGSIVNNGDIINDGALASTTGDITNTDSLTGSGTVVSAADLDNSGTINVTNTITAANDVINSGTLTSTDDVTATAGDVANTGDLTTIGDVTAGTDITNGATSTFIAINIMAGADIVNDNDMTATGFIMAGDTITNSGTMMATGDITATNVITNTGTMTSNAGGIVQGTTVNNSGTFTSTTQVIGDLVNSGTSNVEGVVTGDVTSNAGTFTMTNNLNVSGDFTNEGSSTLDLTTGMLMANGTFTQSSSVAVTIDATESIVAGAVDNQTDVVNNGDYESKTTTFTNSGDISGTGNVTAMTDLINDGSLTATNVTVGGDLTNATGGQMNLSGNSTIGGAVDNDGTIANTGVFAATGDIDNSGTLTALSGGTISTGGQVLNSGSLTSTTQVTGNVRNTGTATLVGVVSGTVRNQNSGDMTFNGDLAIGNNLLNFGNAVLNHSGNTTVAGTFNHTSNEEVSIAAGDSITANDVTATGDLNNAGTLAATGGDIDSDGDLENSGTMTATGDINNTSGTMANTGTMTAVTITNDDVFNSGGVMNGDFVNNGDFTLTSLSTLSGGFDNNGTFTSTGPNLTGMSGDFDNTGGAFTASGNTSIVTTGAFLNQGSAVNATGTLNITASMLDNTNAEFNVANANVIGDFNNTGGTIDLDGDVIITGALNNSGGNIDALDGAADDTVTVGSLTGDGSLMFDADLFDDPADPTDFIGSDTLTVLGDASGTVELSFTLADGVLGNTQTPVSVVTVDGTDTVTFVSPTGVTNFGLPDNGAAPIIYTLDQSGNGASIVAQTNQAVGALSGNISLVQALIGTVINRPSSPFVSGLAYDDDDNCGEGIWTRAQAGRAEATGRTSNGISNLPATVNSNFSGMQIGFDYGCFNNSNDTFDIAGGGVIGFNQGTIDQTVFGINPLDPTQLDPTNITSTTNADFKQQFFGAYVAAAKGSLTGDLQLRFDQTEFTFTNTDFGGGNSLGLVNETVKSNSITVSSSVAYSVPINDNWTIVPTGGFGFTNVETETLNFRNPAGDVIGTLALEDHTTKIVFAGATAAYTKIGEAGDSATNTFATATVYNDFSDARRSIYTDFEGGGSEASLATENLGTFGELSLGLSYVKILDGQIGKGKQLNASVRVDTRFSDRIDAISATAQIRLQF